MTSAAASGGALGWDVLSSGEVFLGRSVGVNDGLTDIGSVGTGERTPSGTDEDADAGDTAVTNTAVGGMTSEKEGKTDA